MGIHPLGVSVSPLSWTDGWHILPGERPVINLKLFRGVSTLQDEGIQTFKNLVKLGDWMVKVDLKDAYFSVPMGFPQPLLVYMYLGYAKSMHAYKPHLSSTLRLRAGFQNPHRLGKHLVPSHTPGGTLYPHCFIAQAY